MSLAESVEAITALLDLYVCISTVLSELIGCLLSCGSVVAGGTDADAELCWLNQISSDLEKNKCH